jgi:hypothetical protein
VLPPARAARASVMVVISEVSVIGDGIRLQGIILLGAPTCVYVKPAVVDVLSYEPMQGAASAFAHAGFCWMAAVSRRYGNGNSAVAGSIRASCFGGRRGRP